VNGWAPHEIHGKKGDLNSVDLRRAEVKLDPETGSIKINLVGQEIRTEHADIIIGAIGQGLRMHDLPKGVATAGGIISTDQFQRTSASRVFAGGDAVGGKAFVAHAIASGKMGALSIHCFLEGRDVETEFQAHQIVNSQAFSFHHLIEHPENGLVDLNRGVSFDQINTLFFSKSPRINPDERRPEKRIKSFEEIREGLDTEYMEQEIERCFRCGTCIDCENCLDFCPDISILKDAKSGVYDFDPDYCKGCGVCSVACPRNIIEMVRDMTCETS
jgi:Pyruvate/2-oxoacid:ferredoxin oxidoreductase delta subunit